MTTSTTAPLRDFIAATTATLLRAGAGEARALYEVGKPLGRLVSRDDGLLGPVPQGAPDIRVRDADIGTVQRHVQAADGSVEPCGPRYSNAWLPNLWSAA